MSMNFIRRKIIRFRDLIVNIYMYRHFSINPNNKINWDRKLSKFGNFWRNENYRHILNLLPKNKAFSLLDVGCALGDGCGLLQNEFPKVAITGIDISSVGIKKAKQKNKKINYFVLDILKTDLPGIYDYITIIQTLEHFDNPFSIIDKLLKHVKKSIIISVPYTLGITGKIDKDVHRYSFNENTFIGTRYNYRIVEVTDFIKSTGSKCIIFEFFPN